jgi:serine/threonine-protein kinase
VYRGRDNKLHRDVAIKVLRGGGDLLARRGLIEEARTLSLLNHPHVAGIYDFVTQGHREFIVMEFIPGATLRDILASGPLPSSEVIRLGAQVAHGLAAAHAAHVVHSDIKPSNLKITVSGELKILDFGVARLMPAGEVVDNDTRTPCPLTGAGTMPYMAPEQIRGDPVDERSDIFSVGTVLYEMATAFPAFPQRNIAALVDALQHKEPPPPTFVNPYVPVALERVITKAMHKEPSERYATAVELAESLEALMPRSGRERDPHAPARRWRSLVTMGA